MIGKLIEQENVNTCQTIVPIEYRTKLKKNKHFPNRNRNLSMNNISENRFVTNVYANYLHIIRKFKKKILAEHCSPHVFWDFRAETGSVSAFLIINLQGNKLSLRVYLTQVPLLVN